MDAARFDRRRRIASWSACSGLGRVSSSVCGSSSRHVWLSGRLRTLLEPGATSGRLRGYSFGVVLVRQDRHLKISIFSDQWTKSFEVDGVGAPARALSDSVRAELLFESESPARPSKLTGWRYGQVDKLPVRVAMAKARTCP